MRFLLSVLLVLVSGLALASDDKVVNFINWGDYIDPSVIKEFTAQTGIQVNQSYFDSPDMLRALLMTGDTGYDVAVPALADMHEMIQANLLMPLDMSQLTNETTQNPALMAKAATLDPNNRYGVIYQWGTTGIAYNATMIRKILGPNAPVNSWDLLMNPIS